MNNPPNPPTDRETAADGDQPNSRRTIDIVNASLKKRYAAERRFRFIGAGAVVLGLFFVAMLFASIVGNGYSAFQQTYIALPVHFDPQAIDPDGQIQAGALTQEEIRKALIRVNFLGVARTALREAFPSVQGRSAKRQLYGLLSPGVPQQLREMVERDPGLIGQTRKLWLIADDDIDMFMKGRSTPVNALVTTGRATITKDGEKRILRSTEADFAPVRDSVRAFLAQQIAQNERSIRRLEGALTETEQRLGDLATRLEALAETDGEDAAARDRLTASLEQARERAAKLDSEIAEAKRRQVALSQRESSLTEGEALGNEMPSFLIAINGGLLRLESIADAQVTGTVLMPLDSDAPAAAGDWQLIELARPASERRLKDQEIAWALSLKEQGDLKKRFNTLFFTQGSSREPELAGIAGAFMGSLYTLTLTLLFSFPIAVGTAIYLEEFAPKNRWTDLIEININNLAAVPSIVFGLLGLAVFINFFGVPRSTPLVAAMVLTLMTLPTIIIASRAALKSVPPSIREAALGIGASPLQTQFHHVLPLAMPGMLTGTIIGMAQALGETAPLLMIGMIAFIVDIPGGFTDPATVLPVQIFLWADSPERGFVERTSAAIMVLLVFLILMNLFAVLLRRRFERRW